MGVRASTYSSFRVVAALLAAATITTVALGGTDAEDRQLMIRESIAAYSGSCPCPYNVDRAGRQCGGRSAYSRPGGASPLCYATDISDEQLARWRARRQR